MLAQRSDTNVPVNLQVDKGGGVTGLTAVVAVRDGATINSYLDFNDDTFKISGWTTRQASMAEIADGVYALSGGLDVSAITNLPAATRHLILEFDVSGTEDGNAIDVIELLVSAYDIPNDVWSKDISGYSAPDAGRILDRIRVYLTNRTVLDIPNQRAIVYEDNGTTVAQRWDLETNTGPPDLVTAPAGTPAKRSDPLDPL